MVLPLVREWKMVVVVVVAVEVVLGSSSSSSYNCTPFLHSLLTKGKERAKVFKVPGLRTRS